MADSNVIVGLDIGTTKILCLVAEVRAPGDVEIIGVSSYPSKGLQRGIVLNIDSGTSANFSTYNVTNDGTNYWARYRVNIDSQLNVDKLCEVFIESMTIVGQTVPDLCQYFAINIEEFNIIFLLKYLKLQNQIQLNHLFTYLLVLQIQIVLGII